MKLHFLWRENHIEYLWASSVTANVYFLHDGILLYENKVLSAYTSLAELKKVNSATKHFAQRPKAVLKLEKEFNTNRVNIDAIKSFYTQRALKNASNEELYEKFLLLIKTLREYINTYRWTEPHYLEILEKITIQTVKEKYFDEETAQKILSRLLSENKNLSKKFNFEDDSMKLFKLINAIAKMRFEAKKIYFPLVEMSEKILRETARRTYFAVSQISSFSLPELKNLLLKNRFPNIETVNERQKIYAIKIYTNNTKRISDLSRQATIKLIQYDRQQTNTSSFKGLIAYPGTVTGIANVAPTLSGKKEYKKYIATLNKNDILVSSMTSPDLTPAFSKIAAVVTDEGGLMSHAALVAREKRIPCVIGTRIATRVLKNGDKIKVDANNGIVTKI